ncbi:MAG: HAD-IIIC family phosphatase [Alphaproteobacteria bacterium]|nr:MAG: HAD-IIIC family phosphatase [Alphaproteobacteria bacterium]
MLGDDGPAGVAIREEVVDLIRQLDDRGIVQSISSKNDHERTWKFLVEKGLAEYFIYPEINWMPKSEGIRRIADNLGLSTNAFAFVDDSDFERGEVSSEIPELRTYDARKLTGLLKRPEFDVPVTVEARKRRQMYREESHRRGLQQEYRSDYRAFLRSCEMRMTISSQFDEAAIERCVELLQRTNQLNLSGNRHDRTGVEHRHRPTRKEGSHRNRTSGRAWVGERVGEAETSRQLETVGERGDVKTCLDIIRDPPSEIGVTIDAAHSAVLSIAIACEPGDPHPIINIVVLARQRCVGTEGVEAATLGSQADRGACGAPRGTDDIDRAAERGRAEAQPIGPLEHLHVTDGERVHLLKLGRARGAADRHPVAKHGQAAPFEAGIEARAANRDAAFTLCTGVGKHARC